MVDALLQAGAAPDLPDGEGFAPLHYSTGEFGWAEDKLCSKGGPSCDAAQQG